MVTTSPARLSSLLIIDSCAIEVIIPFIIHRRFRKIESSLQFSQGLLVLEVPGLVDLKQEIALKKINGDRYEKTLRNGTYAYYLIFCLTY